MTKTRVRMGIAALAIAAVFAVLPSMALAAGLDGHQEPVQALQTTPTATPTATATETGTAAPTGTAPAPGATGNAGLAGDGAGQTGLMIVLGLAALAVGGTLAARAATNRR